MYSRPECISATFPHLSSEIQARPVLSFTKIAFHNAHKLGGCISSMFPRLRKKWASLKVMVILRTYIVYICILKTLFIFLFLRDFFPSYPALLQTSVWKTRENLRFSPQKYFMPAGIGISGLKNACPLCLPRVKSVTVRKT